MKRRREEENGGGGEIDEALLAALESSSSGAGAGGGGGAAVELLDVKGVKKMVLAFERKLRDNIEARMKYVDQPDRFVESEVDLDEELKKMHALAASPDLYPELVRLKVVGSIVSLLGHENTDISTDVVNLLNELTDGDVIGDNEPAGLLVDELVSSNALELLVQNLSRLDEADPDEAAAVFNSLSIVENLIEVRPAVVELVCERSKLLKWLLTRIKVKEFDSNKLYASEILAILLQSSAANQLRLGQLNGVDTLLQSVALYKSRDPKSSEEEEMLENLYDCLCSVVMHPDNKDKFVKAEGVELMVIIMKQKKKLAYGSALKALDFSLTKCSDACERFVDVLGLKSLFPAFMGKVPKKSGEEVDERLISLIYSLFAGLTKDASKERLLSKFEENEYEKIDRLMEFFVKYHNRVKAESKKLDAESFEELDEDDKYLKRLDAGLFTLQLLALILAHIWLSKLPGVQSRIDLLLKQQRLSREDVKSVLQEYRDNVDDEGGKASVEAFISAM
ncbi:hypothetical protein SELMODRAFT_448582 [Selaginella moellendorffii]|uniref:Beta-catenin-like protein 1 N-terminal domain-containing protein n=1 Tax=Selaginella moellendorffii TaxID=88036 RepID=D8T8A5_SELML|nr:beta-catenin-like protein 1 [Selaginella moellendorffii]EFJ07077.1 hypothetical protein SELMODRAFT_448582 [Selaginella moellendorffii]|eukprot:XP_002991815.1 beta-catenin-like protein 1 [Selaginella moellendorffii]